MGGLRAMRRNWALSSRRRSRGRGRRGSGEGLTKLGDLSIRKSVDNFSRITAQFLVAVTATGHYLSALQETHAGEAAVIFINHVKNAGQAKDYYSQHIAPGDYYNGKDAAEMKGVWHGKSAQMLRLSGEVNQEDFFKLCDNINPATGEKLTARTKDDRRVMTDFTFDAPK